MSHLTVSPDAYAAGRWTSVKRVRAWEYSVRPGGASSLSRQPRSTEAVYAGANLQEPGGCETQMAGQAPVCGNGLLPGWEHRGALGSA